MTPQERLARILVLVPGAAVTIRGDQVDWHDERPQPTPEEIAAVPWPPAERWRVMKMTLLNRLTDEEAGALDAAIALMPAKTRMRWAAARWLWSDDADVLAAAAALEWGAERIEELLDRDNDPELAMLPEGAD